MALLLFFVFFITPLWATPISQGTKSKGVIKAPSSPALSAFHDADPLGTVTVEAMGNLFVANVDLDVNYGFSEFFLFLTQGTELYTPSLSDIIPPDPNRWVKYGFIDKGRGSNGYTAVAFQLQSMSNPANSEENFQVWLNQDSIVDAIAGYGFHIKDFNSGDTYFARFEPAAIPEPGSILLLSTGLVFLLPKKRP
jgi:hypothetical protein